NANARQRGRGQDGCIVSLETALWMDGNDAVAIAQAPGLGAVHQGLMVEEGLGCFRRTMTPDVARTRHQLPRDRPDATRDQIGVREVADPERAIEALGNDVYEAVLIGGVDLQERISVRQLHQDGGEKERTEGG